VQRLSYWLWSNGVNKTPPFFHFPVAKGGTCTIAHLLIAKELSFQSLDRRFNDSKFQNEKKDVIQVCREFHLGHLNRLPNWQL
jgi:hypothetical protein